MPPKRLIPTSDLVQVARGFLMGGADIIPGVSGGTVALILGIYDRLVTAISHVDLTLLQHVRRAEWKAAATHLDLRFLVSLGSGIALGIGGLATLMHHLLEYHQEPTYAVFFGLILASSVLVARVVSHWRAVEIAGLIAGAVFAYWLVGLPLLQSPPAGNLYVFFCAVVAICAMILPGISGSFILLILGKYGDITGLLRDFLHGEITLAGLTTIAVFVTGCALGLVSFSKTLRWLLAKYESQTMAVLCGFMIGSLRKIWPFKHDLTPEITKTSHKQFENIWPAQFDGDVIFAIFLMFTAAAFVFALDRLTKGQEHVRELDQEPDRLP